MTTYTDERTEVLTGCRLVLRKTGDGPPMSDWTEITASPLFAIEEVGRIFPALSLCWTHCLELSVWREFVADGPFYPTEFLISRHWFTVYDRERRRNQLQVSHLHVGSLEIELILQAGYTGIGVYGLHMLIRALKDPEAIGSWLPRLRKGWIKGMTDLEHVRVQRATREMTHELDQPESSLTAAARDVRLSPAFNQQTQLEVETFGMGEEPEEIRKAARELDHT